MLPVQSLEDFSSEDSMNPRLTQFKIIVDFIATPDRSKRLLFDQFHSLNYPENGFIWKDNILEGPEEEPFEWLGDNLFTNFQSLYHRLSRRGYYLETLNQPLTCFSAENYKALLLVDIEDYLSEEEITKLRVDIETRGLSLIVVADWYNKEKIEKTNYFNTGTFEEWKPFMGGSNVPTLNALLQPYHIAFGQGVFQGSFKMGDRTVDIVSGSEIIMFPRGGYLLSPQLSVQIEASHQDSNKVKSGSKSDKKYEYKSFAQKRHVPTIGILDGLPGADFDNSGAIIVMTDSDCISQQRQIRSCNFLFEQFVDIATRDKRVVTSGDDDFGIDRSISDQSNPEKEIVGAIAVNSKPSEEVDTTVQALDSEVYFLLREEFILPSDLHKFNEAPVYETLEDLTKELLFDNNQIKNSYLNSLTAYDYLEKKHICPVRNTLKSLAQSSHTMLDYEESADQLPDDYIPYQHLESDENIQTWTASTHTVSSSNWLTSWATFSPVHALLNGQKISGPYAMVFTFFTVFLFGIYCVKRCLLKRAATAQLVRVTNINAR